jgi:hypothetical protein
MTRDEFKVLCAEHLVERRFLIVRTVDAHCGPVVDFDDTGVLVDVYVGNDCTPTHIPFADLHHLGGGAIQQATTPYEAVVLAVLGFLKEVPA